MASFTYLDEEKPSAGFTYLDETTPAKQPEGGLVASAKQAIGQGIKGAGQVAADYIPGVSQKNSLSAYGQSVVDANPTAVQGFGDIVDKPWTTVKEAVGNAAGSMGTMVGARALGMGITAAAPFTGPAAPVVAGAGQLIANVGPIVAAALPSYSGIREAQIQDNPNNEADAKSKAIALLGAGTVGAIETKFGPQEWALAAMRKGGIEALGKKFAGQSLPKAIGTGVLKGGAIEGGEELVQNPIEQLASYQDPRTPENVKETLFGGAMGAIGGGVLGGMAGAIAPRTQANAPQDIGAGIDLNTTVNQPEIRVVQDPTTGAPVEVNKDAGPLSKALDTIATPATGMASVAAPVQTFSDQPTSTSQLPQEATNFPLPTIGAVAEAEQAETKQAYEINQNDPTGEPGSSLHALTKSEQGRRAARTVMEGDPNADEKIILLAIAEINRRQNIGIDTDHMQSDALAKTGWSATQVIQKPKQVAPVQTFSNQPTSTRSLSQVATNLPLPQTIGQLNAPSNQAPEAVAQQAKRETQPTEDRPTGDIRNQMEGTGQSSGTLSVAQGQEQPAADVEIPNLITGGVVRGTFSDAFKDIQKDGAAAAVRYWNSDRMTRGASGGQRRAEIKGAPGMEGSRVREQWNLGFHTKLNELSKTLGTNDFAPTVQDSSPVAQKPQQPAPQAEQPAADAPALTDIRPPKESINDTAKALTNSYRILGDRTVPIDSLVGGVGNEVGDQKRVRALADKLAGPDAYIERLIVDDAGNVIEGQHRLDALKLLGVKQVPVVVIQDFERNFPSAKVKEAMTAAQKIPFDNVNKLAADLAEIYADEKGDLAEIAQYDAPRGYEKAWAAGLNALSPTKSEPTPATLEADSKASAPKADEGKVTTAQGGAASAIKSYPEDQATKLAASMTKKGLPSEAYPHPTEEGKFAIRAAGTAQTTAPVGKQVVTQDIAGNFKTGQIVSDSQGNRYLAHSARQGWLDVFPIVDGKPVVNRESKITFHLNPETVSGFPERRSDPVFVERSTPAQHIENGNTEAASVPVIEKALKTGAANSPLDLREEHANLLKAIDEAIATVPASFKGLDPELRVKTFDVPGDGKFKIQNTAESLKSFRAKIVSIKSAFSPPAKPAKHRSPLGRVTGGKPGSSAVRNLLDDGDLTAAYELANAIDSPIVFGAYDPDKAKRPIVYTDAEPFTMKGLESFPMVSARIHPGNGWAVIDLSTGMSVNSAGFDRADIEKKTQAKAVEKEMTAEKYAAMVKDQGKTQSELSAEWLAWAEKTEADASERADKYNKEVLERMGGNITPLNSMDTAYITDAPKTTQENLRDRIERVRKEKAEADEAEKAERKAKMDALRAKKKAEKTPKLEAPAPVETPAAEQNTGTLLTLMKDGIDGAEVEAERVPNGNASYQYALGKTAEDGTVSVYRRRTDERGTYGGWRWEADANKLTQPAAEKPKSDQQQRADGDLRGFAYALVKNGQVLTSGSFPTPEYMEAEDRANVEFWKKEADRLSADLFIGGYPNASTFESQDSLIFGMTWEQIKSRQQGSKFEFPASLRGKMPKDAVRIYEAQEKPQSEPAPVAAEKSDGTDYTEVLREDLGVSQTLIDGYTPEEKVIKAGRYWSYITMAGNEHPSNFDTKRKALDAARKHLELKKDQFDNPAGFRDIVSVLARKRLELIEKYMKKGMSEMEAGAKARQDIPDVRKKRPAVDVAKRPDSKGEDVTPREAHAALFKDIYDGTATLDEYKAGFQATLDAEDAIKAELNGLTKDALFKEYPGLQYRYKNEKKADVVNAAYRSMLDDFVLGDSISYSIGEKYENVLRNYVERETAESLAAYSAKLKAKDAERETRLNEIKQGAEDPKTLDDFMSYFRVNGQNGETFGELRKKLTPEQRALYDSLASEKTRAERKEKADQQKTDIRAAAQTTEGQIVETKHTKTGEALFVVKAAERVERDVYNQWNATAKRLGGYYSSFRGTGAVPGFQFKTMGNAEAFLKFIGGDVSEAKETIQIRRDEFADDRSQSAVERLTEMSDRLDERADESLSRERKANTNRRARFAASAESSARSDKALAATMRNIAKAIENGLAKLLDRVRQKSQVEMLQEFIRNAKNTELREKYPSYVDQEKNKGEAPGIDTVEYAQWPSYIADRSDLANLGRQLVETEGTKKLGQQILKVADDVTAEYKKFAKENLFRVSTFKGAEGQSAVFRTEDDAERAIARSGFKGKATTISFKRGEHLVIMGPSMAREAGIWQGDDRKRITLTPAFGAELVEKVGKVARGNNNAPRIPWQFENAYDKRKRLAAMGIETPAEFRSALREFISLREQAKEPDRIKELERAMIGRKNDGLDFFPTPKTVAQEMIDAAEIKEGMSVLEPSAGMGHIAEQIRDVAGIDPDVVEMSNDRKELLEAKGFRVVGFDFMDVLPRGFTYGDIYRAKDGTLGVMRGSGGMGSNRVGLDPLDENGNPDMRRARWEDRDELEEVEKRNGLSGYDRIIMNPPFSDRRDAQHVQHAYTLLKPGGRVVALMGEGVFFGQDSKAKEFRAWLDSLNGTSEKLDEGTFLDPSLPVNTSVNARLVVVDKPVSGVEKFNQANDGRITPADRTIYGMAAEGKSAQYILKHIASTSRNPFYRQVAKLLLKTGINPTITVGDSTGWKFNAGDGKYAAAYDPKTDTVALFRPASSERNVVHELIHSASIKALEKNGLASMQLKALFNHVKKSGKLQGMYGMADIDEFMAEVFSNPKFQQALKKIDAPIQTSGIRTAWDWFIRAVRNILGLKQGSQDALSRALDIGLGVMKENMALKKVGPAVPRTTAEAGVVQTSETPGGQPDSSLANKDIKYNAADASETAKTPIDKAPYTTGPVKVPERDITSAESQISSGKMIDDALIKEANAFIKMMSAHGISIKDPYVHNNAIGGKSVYIDVPGFGEVRFSDHSRISGLAGDHSFPTATDAYNAVLDSENRRFSYWKNVKKLRDDIGIIEDTDDRKENMRIIQQWLKDNPQQGQKKDVGYWKGALELSLISGDWSATPVPKRKFAPTPNNAAKPGVPEGMKERSTVRADNTGSLKEPSQSNVGAGSNENVGDESGNVKPIGKAKEIEVDGVMRSTLNSNTGAFSPDNPDIRYNIADDARNWVKAQASPGVQQAVANVFKSDASTSWVTSFNTQYHKAEKWAAEGKPWFKRVFDLGQKFLSDTSRFAIMAQNAAPKLFHEWKSLSDVKDSLKNAKSFRDLTGATHNANISAIATPLYEGTLMGGGSPMQGVRFTDVILRKTYGLTDEQIKLYNEALDAVNVSLDEMAKSIIAKHAKNNKVGFDSDMGIDDMAADVIQNLEDQQQELEEEIGASAEEAYSAALADLIEMDQQDEAAKLKRDFARTKKDNAKAIDRIDKTIKDINGIVEKNQQLQDHGYFPLMRFGDNTVTATDENGETQFFGMYEGLPMIPRSGQYQANQVAQAIREEHPEWTVTTGINNTEKYKLYRGLNLEAVQLFAEHMDAESLEPFQEYLRQATNDRSVMKRLIHRKGTPGFSKDVRRTLAQFIVSNARHTSSSYNLFDMRKAAEDVPNQFGDIGKEAVKLHQYVSEPMEEAQKLRGFLFFNYLGGSIASSMVNMTQIPMMTFPFLSQYEGVTVLGKRLASAAKLAASHPDKIAGKLGDALRRAELDGVTAPQEIFQMTATAANSIFSGSRGANFLLQGWGKMFSMAEVFNRRTTFIAAFNIADQMSKEQLTKTGFKTAFDFAENAVKETQGIYNKGNRPNVGRGAVGASLMTFKQYSIMYLELLKRLPRKQQLIMLGLLMLAAGAGGLPFAEDIEDIIDTFGQWLGYATNTKRSIRNAVSGAVGTKAADILLNGALSQMGIDLHGRMGMSNLIPATGIMKKSSIDKGRDVEEFFGPAGSLITSLGKALENMATGHFDRAAMALAPVAVQNAVKGSNMADTGFAEDLKGRRTVPVNQLEAGAKSIGFNPKSVANFGTIKRDLAQDQRLLQVKREEITSGMASAILANDQEARKDMIDELQQWNRDNPNMRLTIDFGAVAQRVRQARAEGVTRFMKTLPKSMKQSAREEFAQ